MCDIAENRNKEEVTSPISKWLCDPFSFKLSHQSTLWSGICLVIVFALVLVVVDFGGDSSSGFEFLRQSRHRLVLASSEQHVAFMFIWPHSNTVPTVITRAPQS